MIKRIIILPIALIFTILLGSSNVYAAPTKLIAVPFSVQEGETTKHKVELNWDMGAGDTGYDIWMSKNGYEWEKLNKTQSVSENTYIVNEDKIELYVNYYFIVTNYNSVTSNPVEEAESTGDNPQSSDIAVAFPPGQTIHGNYKNNTNACAKCHRTHDSSEPSLLIQNTINDTCKTCHDGTQSKYDVFRGEIKSTQGYLSSNSGPFGDIFGLGSNDKNGDSIADPFPDNVMSIHSISDNVYLYQAQKSSSPIRSEAWDKTLGCGSCHYVHGSEYADKNDPNKTFVTSNYRMLATSLPGNNDVRVMAFAETIQDKVYGGGYEKIYYKSGMTNFCVGCHVDWYNPSSVTGETYGRTLMTKNHLIGNPLTVLTDAYGNPRDINVPLEGPFTAQADYNKNSIMCLTCHSAHGSTSVRDNDLPNYLLRVDNDGCLQCHTVEEIQQ